MARHTLTRESQELTVTALMIASAPDCRLKLATEIPICSQLNNITSALATPAKFGVTVKPKIRDGKIESIVNSSLAHMSLSSPVSVGMSWSNRTLEAGSWQVKPTGVEHFPTAEGRNKP